MVKNDTKPVVTDTQIEIALGKSAGVLHATAKALGLTRQSLIQRIENSEALQAARKEAIDTSLDAVESKLIASAKRGIGWAVKLYLTNIGRDRGYGRKLEISGVIGVGEVHVLQLPDNGRDRVDDDDQDATETEDESRTY